MNGLDVRPFVEGDRDWARALLAERWAGPCIVTRGRVHRADLLPGFVAHVDGCPVGLVTHRFAGDDCEIVSLDATVEGRGVGTALVEAVRATALDAGCRRLWLVTTNDNHPALRFWQRRGFRVVAVHADAIRESRRLKSGIPLTGCGGVPIRDEIELSLDLA